MFEHYNLDDEHDLSDETCIEAGILMGCLTRDPETGHIHVTERGSRYIAAGYRGEHESVIPTDEMVSAVIEAQARVDATPNEN